MEDYVRRIGKASCAIDGTYSGLSKLSNVKENLFWLLYVLDDGEFYTQKQICEDWLFPKTTINTLIKECEATGYITLRQIPGRRRELQICLTDAGRAYARQTLNNVYEVEQAALAATLKRCSPDFIAGLEIFSEEFHAALEKFMEKERN